MNDNDNDSDNISVKEINVIEVSTQDNFTDPDEIDQNRAEINEIIISSQNDDSIQISEATIDLTDDDVEEIFWKELWLICSKEKHLISTKWKHKAWLEWWQAWLSRKAMCPFWRNIITIQDSFIKIPIAKMNLILAERDIEIDQAMLID